MKTTPEEFLKGKPFSIQSIYKNMADFAKVYYKEMYQNTYVLVQFPEVQLYQEEEWFDEECSICCDVSGAYFIPQNRIHIQDNTGI